MTKKTKLKDSKESEINSNIDVYKIFRSKGVEIDETAVIQDSDLTLSHNELKRVKNLLE